MDELIAQLAATPATLAHLVAEADDFALDAAPGGQWNARTILAHFRDDEFLCMRAAVTRMLAEQSPVLHFLDGTAWEPGRSRLRDRKEWLLGDFALQRQASLGILRMVRPEDLHRRGIREGREFSLEQLIGVWVRHDREHVAQLEQALGETLEDVRARRAREG
ncbi:DinB family protein [Candidatus Amarobacter glycogenicus]|uniref:DinB family protein n=1 Tax=Candidatus Amarobacter glycogenicus TaxID=3140699 RepID=UPI00313664DD|nr:DinB family protein [Dehalococcoidia bacterium]